MGGRDGVQPTPLLPHAVDEYGGKAANPLRHRLTLSRIRGRGACVCLARAKESPQLIPQAAGVVVGESKSDGGGDCCILEVAQRLGGKVRGTSDAHLKLRNAKSGVSRRREVAAKPRHAEIKRKNALGIAPHVEKANIPLAHKVIKNIARLKPKPKKVIVSTLAPIKKSVENLPRDFPLRLCVAAAVDGQQTTEEAQIKLAVSAL